jgi:Chromosome segregation ATPases
MFVSPQVKASNHNFAFWGEAAMTAPSFVIAVFFGKPSPICVFE